MIEDFSKNLKEVDRPRISTRDLPNASLVRYHVAISLVADSLLLHFPPVRGVQSRQQQNGSDTICWSEILLSSQQIFSGRLCNVTGGLWGIRSSL